MILSALILSGALLAEVTTATPPPAAATSAEKLAEGRLVCRSEAQPGTLMTKKICYRVAPKPAADAKAADVKPTPPANN